MILLALPFCPLPCPVTKPIGDTGPSFSRLPNRRRFCAPTYAPGLRITPIQVGLLQLRLDALFVVSIFIDLIFFVDMILQLSLSV